MIQLEPYSEKFETEYWNAVDKKLKAFDRGKFMDSCKKYLPLDFFANSDNEFKSLILARKEKLKAAEAYISGTTIDRMNRECFSMYGKKMRMKRLYRVIHDCYSSLAGSTLDRTSLRVRIVQNTGLTVCPYCNRDYINSRGKKISGAQLDHFFNKAAFPLFSVCLYNLIPVCGNCNRVKSDKALKFASPFDGSLNWIEDLTFSYIGTTPKDMRIKITADGNLKNNIETMKIEQAYQIHSTEVLELIEKEQMYNQTQKDELQEMLERVGLTDKELKKMIFGAEITKESMRTKPLGKMMHDLHKELKIYD
ncbi:hypothetical protein J4772_23630 [Cohnella sp. LGH]|uniref:hypothetical protein n=1 Tax=Cohnella sp. LGH TaxID=1619153 RepID=UPI001ADC2394|nr:hypothetical protein [Cohnella sp. LGH]QTH40560.1 hypothetical protein J4772_23630 [Cohnella sp. LGH]